MYLSQIRTTLERAAINGFSCRQEGGGCARAPSNRGRLAAAAAESASAAAATRPPAPSGSHACSGQRLEKYKKC